MQDANERDLSQFERWYLQAGTPIVKATDAWDAETGTYSLALEQTVPDTPGQTDKSPMQIPVRVPWRSIAAIRNMHVSFLDSFSLSWNAKICFCFVARRLACWTGLLARSWWMIPSWSFARHPRGNVRRRYIESVKSEPTPAQLQHFPKMKSLWLVTFLILTKVSKTFELKVEGASAKPVPSLLRGFSAPVKLEHLASFTRYKVIPTDLKLNDVQSLSADSHLIAWDQVGGIGNKSETIRLTSCLRKGMTTAMRISHCWLALTLIPSIDGSQCSVWDQRRLNRSTHYILAYASSV